MAELEAALIFAITLKETAEINGMPD